jgi:hypothetical protein
MRNLLRSFALLGGALLCTVTGYTQRYLSDYDSTLFIIDTLRTVVKRFENLHIGAYMQPQYQVTSEKGANSFAGGNFQDMADNRFMLRRARVKIDYRLPGKDGSFPLALFTFQFEATERDMNVRDVFVRIYEPGSHAFSLTAGLFARPFGYEVNLSSSVRESPERGRMSQTLMPSERDLGAMVSYEQQHPKGKGPQLKFDVGLFNGQGKSGPAEFDSYKDLISRLGLKPYKLGGGLTLSAGLSYLNGGWARGNRFSYRMGEKGGDPVFAVDSNLSNIGTKAERRYYGGDVQLALEHGWGKTEIRGEYWRGKQPGTASSTVNPGTLPEAPTYVRPFDGAFFYFLQNIVNEKWELIVKYDWYDPNRLAKGAQIGKAGTNLTPGDIRYNTLGAGLTRHLTPTLKLLVYYDAVRNEKTLLPGFTEDLEDNVLTCRIQMRF